MARAAARLAARRREIRHLAGSAVVRIEWLSFSDCQPSVVLKTRSTSPSSSRSTMCGRPCATLLTALTGSPFACEMRGGPARRDDRETELDQLLDRGHDIVLVGVLDRYERGPALRQDHPGAEQGLGECDVEIAIDSHDFARALHFRSEDGIGAREAREGEHGLLDRDIIRDRAGPRPDSPSVSPAITRAAILATRRARPPWRRTARSGSRAD